jgi:hypothetical protein
MKKLIQILIVLPLLILIGCAANSVGDINQRLDESKKIETLLFNQMPLPKDAHISPEKSMILGEGDNWAGRIELSSSMSILEVSSYFTAEYPKFNWVLISSTKSKTAVVVFANSSRTLTIEVSEGSALSSKSMIVMTVAPRVLGREVPEAKKQ